MSVNIPDLPGLDTESLFRQETFTDLAVGTLQRLTPIKADGSDDPSRSVVYVGSTSVLTPQGTLPIQGEIEAKSMKEAIEKFPGAMKKAVEDMVKQAREMEQKMRSEIVIPQGGVGAIPGAAKPSRIQLA